MHLCLPESCREFLSTQLSVTRGGPLSDSSLLSLLFCRTRHSFSGASKAMGTSPEPSCVPPSQLAITRYPRDTYIVLQWRHFIPTMWEAWKWLGHAHLWKSPACTLRDVSKAMDDDAGRKPSLKWVAARIRMEQPSPCHCTNLFLCSKKTYVKCVVSLLQESPSELWCRFHIITSLDVFWYHPDCPLMWQLIA